MDNQELQYNQEEQASSDVKAEKSKSGNKKLFFIITYGIAVLCMLAGLFVPLFGFGNATKMTGKMFFTYVPDLLNALLYPLTHKSIVTIPENGFFSAVPKVDKFDTIYLSLIIFAVACVISLIMLIPVFVSNKNGRTFAVCAYIAEILALLSGGYFIAACLTQFVWGMKWQYFNFIIVFGGVLAVMAVQSVYGKGGLGVTKIILCVLSALIFIFLVPLASSIPGIGKGFNALSRLLGGGETASFSSGTFYVFGIYGLDFVTVLKYTTDILPKIFYIAGGVLACLCLFNLAYDVIEIALHSKYNKNGIYNSNRGMSIFAIVRYALALLLAVACIILLIIAKDADPGVYLYLITVLALIQLIFVIVRAIVLFSKHKKAVAEDAVAVKPESAPEFNEEFNFAAEDEHTEDSEETITIETPVYEEEHIYESAPEQAAEEPAAEEQPAEEPQPEESAEPEEQAAEEPVADEQPVGEEPVYEEPVYEEPVYEEPEQDNDKQLSILGDEHEEEPEPEPEHTYVYNYRPVYKGPTDDFMDTLDDAEKIEFVQVFLEKKKGTIKGVPEYNIGGENSRFFPAVFIHINRSRELVSSRLLEKIYKQIGKH